MSENKISIPCEDGTVETLNLLCSFDYAEKHYFLAQDPYDKELVCRQIKWNILKGTYLTDNTLSNTVLRIANILLRESDNNPGDYPLDGEHYLIDCTEQDGERIFIPTRRDSSKYFSPFMMNISTWVQFTISLFISMLYTFIYIKSSGMMWAATVFPNIPRIPLTILLYVIEIAGITAMFIIRDEDNRNLIDYILNAFIPVNMFSAIGLAKVNIIVRIIMICCAVLFVLFRVIPLFLHITSEKSKTKRRKKGLYALRKMYVPIFSCVVVCVLIIRIFGISGYTNISATKTTDANSEEIVTHYEEAMKNINVLVWKDLNEQQRVDTLQSICDYECACVLGCDTATVQAGYTKEDNTLGEYNHVTNTVLININHLREDDVEDTLNTLLHEVRHAYQHTVIDMFNKVEGKLDEKDLRLPIFRYASSLRENFDDYKSGNNDFYEYYGQASEEDSRDWAEEEVYKYTKIIYKDILSKNKK